MRPSSDSHLKRYGQLDALIVITTYEINGRVEYGKHRIRRKIQTGEYEHERESGMVMHHCGGQRGCELEETKREETSPAQNNYHLVSLSTPNNSINHLETR